MWFLKSIVWDCQIGTHPFYYDYIVNDIAFANHKLTHFPPTSNEDEIELKIYFGKNAPNEYMYGIPTLPLVLR